MMQDMWVLVRLVFSSRSMFASVRSDGRGGRSCKSFKAFPNWTIIGENCKIRDTHPSSHGQKPWFSSLRFRWLHLRSTLAGLLNTRKHSEPRDLILVPRKAIRCSCVKWMHHVKYLLSLLFTAISVAYWTIGFIEVLVQSSHYCNQLDFGQQPLTMINHGPSTQKQLVMKLFVDGY